MLVATAWVTAGARRTAKKRQAQSQASRLSATPAVICYRGSGLMAEHGAAESSGTQGSPGIGPDFKSGAAAGHRKVFRTWNQCSLSEVVGLEWAGEARPKKVSKCTLPTDLFSEAPNYNPSGVQPGSNSDCQSTELLCPESPPQFLRHRRREAKHWVSPLCGPALGPSVHVCRHI